MTATLRIAAGVVVTKFDLFPIAAVEQSRTRGLWQLGPGSIDVEVVVQRQTLQQLEIVFVMPVPAAHRAAGKGKMRVRNDALRVKEILQAEAVAAGAGARRVVKGKQPRLEIRHRKAAFRTGVATGKRQWAQGRIVGKHHARGAIAEPQCRLEGLGQALAELGADAESVHDRLDRVLASGRQRGDLIEFIHGTVHAHACKALAGQFTDQLRVFSLAVSHQRGQQQCGLLRGRRQHLIDHLSHALRRQVDAVVRATRQAGTGIQQPQVVVDLGDGPHR